MSGLGTGHIADSTRGPSRNGVLIAINYLAADKANHPGAKVKP